MQPMWYSISSSKHYDEHFTMTSKMIYDYDEDDEDDDDDEQQGEAWVGCSGSRCEDL